MDARDTVLTQEKIKRYIGYLQEQERSAATIQKYAHDLTAFCKYLRGVAITKTALIEWKQHLAGSYAPASVNSMLAAVNGFLSYMGWPDMTVKPLKIQKNLFMDEQRELSRLEYERLVKAAERTENERLSLVIQTICATGIRVSELRYITVEAIQTGRAMVANKGKRRVVFLPGQLRKLLKAYAKKQKKSAGPVFTTRTGRPLNRSNIWRDMKRLCKLAGVAEEKVFPHNLRHLFARTFYSLERDISRLADLLGHSSINTTRIYTAESGNIHAQQVERMKLIIT